MSETYSHIRESIAVRNDMNVREPGTGSMSMNRCRTIARRMEGAEMRMVVRRYR